MKNKIIINGKGFDFNEGESVLTILQNNGFEIPSLCHHSDLIAKGSCRLCLVEVSGINSLSSSCSLKAEPNMEIKTDTPDIRKAITTNLELLFSQHCEECHDCVWNLKCALLDLAKKYDVKINKYIDRKKDYPIYSFGPALEFDSRKCIDCRNCVEMCEKQGVGYLELRKNGDLTEVFPSENEKIDCIYCGQCIIHCPVGAFEAVGEFEGIEDPFLEKGKTIIFQIAPSVRVSIGEEFGIEPGSPETERLVAALKEIGADKVFDVSTGADVTTVEEAKEFTKRLDEGGVFPMMTSCCPSWVRFIEFNYPEMIPNFTTARSPHIVLGGLIKTYWAQKEGIDPKNIVVASIMPCVSKKYEILRKELENNGIKPVDYVLTVRELGRLIKKKKIDFKNIQPIKPDIPFGDPSGAGVIYGSSGGLMTSALREFIKDDIAYNETSPGIREVSIKLGEKELNLAVVDGLGNAKRLVEEIKKGDKNYHYIEVMACKGGCLGGGGQPIPTDDEIRKKRKEGILNAATKMTFRKASDRNEVKDIYNNFLNSEDNIHSVCHTKYFKKNKNE